MTEWSGGYVSLHQIEEVRSQGMFDGEIRLTPEWQEVLCSLQNDFVQGGAGIKLDVQQHVMERDIHLFPNKPSMHSVANAIGWPTRPDMAAVNLGKKWGILLADQPDIDGKWSLLGHEMSHSLRHDNHEAIAPAWEEWFADMFAGLIARERRPEIHFQPRYPELTVIAKELFQKVAKRSTTPAEELFITFAQDMVRGTDRTSARFVSAVGKHTLQIFGEIDPLLVTDWPGLAKELALPGAFRRFQTGLSDRVGAEAGSGAGSIVSEVQVSLGNALRQLEDIQQKLQVAASLYGDAVQTLAGVFDGSNQEGTYAVYCELEEAQERLQQAFGCIGLGGSDIRDYAASL